MNISSNWFLEKGTSHLMCEDYCIAGERYAIVSDGCSGSEHTDIGARILTTCARNLAQTLPFNLYTYDSQGYAHFLTAVIRHAQRLTRELYLKEDSLNCTLNTLIVAEDNEVHHILAGDGALVVLLRNGTYEVTTTTFLEEMPYYLSYSTSPQLQHAYLKTLQDRNIRTDLLTKNVTVRTFDKDSELVETVSKDYPYDMMTGHVIDTGKVKAAFVLSDGVETFVDKGITQLSTEPFMEIAKLKSFKGPFLERRMKRMFKDFKSQGFENFDDFSIAGMYFGD